MLAFGGVSFFTGIAFLMMGAWPVFGFFGLDVALLYWAIRINNRRAAAFEQVTVTPSALTVRKVSHRGKVHEWVLNPLWVRLDKDIIEDFGIARLFLVMRDKQLTIANFLAPHERAKLRHARSAPRSERSQARPGAHGAGIARNRVAVAPRRGLD